MRTLRVVGHDELVGVQTHLLDAVLLLAVGVRDGVGLGPEGLREDQAEVAEAADADDGDLLARTRAVPLERSFGMSVASRLAQRTVDCASVSGVDAALVAPVTPPHIIGAAMKLSRPSGTGTAKWPRVRW